MARVRVGSVRGTTAAVAAVALLAAPVAAWAGSATPSPAITSAPGAVRFKAEALITGRLNNGTPGETVHLERWRPNTGWKRIAAQATDEENRVRFRLSDLRRSAGYRLLYIDGTTGDTARSGPERIAVAAALRLQTSKTHVIEGRRLRVHGTLYPKVAGRKVILEQKVSGSWQWVTRMRAGDGSFSTYFRPGDDGYRRLRVRFTGDDYNRKTGARRAIRVYEPSLATWYGPGFYGNRTACGQRLGYSTLGVAHRSLPCGTKVNILYQGRTITVPVIDRGPYSSADWDLTRETADRLHFSGKNRIGTQR